MKFSGCFSYVLVLPKPMRSARIFSPILRQSLLQSPLLPLLLLHLFMNENMNDALMKTDKTPDILDVFMNSME